MSQQLVDYILQQIKNGRSAEEIKNNLAASGWKEEDIQRGFADADKMGSKPLESGLKPSNKFSNLKSGMFLLVVIAFLAIASFGIWYFKDTKSNDFSKKDGKSILESLQSNSQNIKSLGFSGIVKFKNRMEDAENNFEGEIVFPETIHVSQSVKNTSIYNDYEGKDPKTISANAEIISADKKIFEKKSKDGEWSFNNISDLTREKPWLTLYYADNLEYIDKVGEEYHYKIKSKNFDFGIAASPIRNMGIEFGVNSTAGSLASTDVEGEIWIDKNYFISKEKIRIPTSEGGANIEINYNNYNKNFAISAPFETPEVDEQIESMEELERQLANPSPEFEKQMEDMKNMGLSASKVNILEDIQIPLKFYFDDNDFYPESLNNLDVNSDLEESIREYGILYAYSKDKKKYHVGIKLDKEDYPGFGKDKDFNSKTEGFINGFDGADPIYDLVPYEM